jgi:hypothetical protein
VKWAENGLAQKSSNGVALADLLAQVLDMERATAIVPGNSPAITGHSDWRSVGITGDRWREAFALVGVVLIRVPAFARMAFIVPPAAGRHWGATTDSPFFLR